MSSGNGDYRRKNISKYGGLFKLAAAYHALVIADQFRRRSPGHKSGRPRESDRQTARSTDCPINAMSTPFGKMNGSDTLSKWRLPA